METSNTYQLIKNSVYNSKLENSELVQIIELCADFLNLETISNYAKNNGMSYNGVKKCRNIIIIKGIKFVIDNE